MGKKKKKKVHRKFNEHLAVKDEPFVNKLEESYSIFNSLAVASNKHLEASEDYVEDFRFNVLLISSLGQVGADEEIYEGVFTVLMDLIYFCFAVDSRTWDDYIYELKKNNTVEIEAVAHSIRLYSRKMHATGGGHDNKQARAVAQDCLNELKLALEVFYKKFSGYEISKS